MISREERSASTLSSASSRSWRTLFRKRRVNPSVSLEYWCKTMPVPVEDGRIIRVLQTSPDQKNIQSASAPSLSIYEDKTVFFIHGVGGSAEIWKKQMTYFHMRGYRTVAPDLLGHGESSKPYGSSAYNFCNLGRDMLKVFDTFQGKYNIIVGHSYGASFATLIATERTSSVAKVILISGGPPTSLKPERLSVFCLPLPIFTPIKPIVVKRFRSMAFHSNIKEHTTSFTLPAYVLKAVMQGQQWPEGNEEYHGDLLVPVLLIYGRSDKFVTLEEELWTEEVIYGSNLEIVEEAGHMVMIEKPDVVNQLILKFLNRDATTRSMVDLSQASAAVLFGEESPNRGPHIINHLVNKDLLHNEISGASRPPSRSPSRVSRHGSEKRTKVVL